MKSKTLAVALASLLLGTVATGARAEGSGDIKYGNRVVAKGFESSTGYTAYMCDGSGITAKRGKFFTKSVDYRTNVDVYYTEPGWGFSERIYTVKPNGDVVRFNSTLVVGKLGYSSGVTGTTVTYSDKSGIKKGHVTWTPVSGAFYNAQGAVIGSYGRAADGDMRMLAFTFFHLSPDNGCLGS
jgi:hypothetical protein